MQSSDAWNVTYESTYEFVPESFPIAGITIPVGVYKASMVRGTYSLGAQPRMSGDITAAVGGFYGGDRTDVGYRGRVEVTPRLSVEPAVSVNWLDLPADAVTAVVTSLRGMYSFSPVMTVAALLQYNSTADLFSTNVRFRWEYRPGSDFFLVYTDGRDTLRSGFMLNRSFAAKLTRLIRF